MTTGNTQTASLPRPAAVAMRRSLNGCFVDFPMLPALLGKVRRRAGRDAVQDCWADFLSREEFDDECQWLGNAG